MNIPEDIEEQCRRLKIGYVPMTHSLEKIGDRGRFCYYANKRNIKFEIADPDKTYDLVVVTHRGDLSIWSQYDKGNSKIVYDIVDSYLAVPRSDIKGLLRGLAKFISRQNRYLQLDHWKAIQSMCKRADAVICGTQEQKEDILPFCSNTHIILDAQSTIARSQKEDYSSGETFNLVWQGLPENIIFFNEIKDVLQSIKSNYDIALHIITNLSYYQYLNKFKKRYAHEVAQKIFHPVYLYDWNEELCSKIITSCDLALIPMSLEDPFFRGKPENKLLLFWLMAMPAIVSATPAYSRAMAQADLTMACRTQQDWYDTLETYIKDETARKEAGQKGQAFAEKQIGEKEILGRWDQLFNSIYDL